MLFMKVIGLGICLGDGEGVNVCGEKEAPKHVARLERRYCEKDLICKNP